MTAVGIGSWHRANGPGVVGTVSQFDTLSRLSRIEDPNCHIIEVRLDQLIGDDSGWLKPCRELHGSGMPLILTLRHESERGQWAGTNSQRLEMLCRIRSWIAGVDVEIQQDAVASAVRALDGITIIGSFHDFERTPPDEELDAIVHRGAEAGAHIVKIASWVGDDATLERLEGLPARHPEVALALVGMGPLGPESRVRLPRSGSCLTYGFLDASVAPGQVPAAELMKILG